MKTAPSKTPTFYIFPPFLPKPPPQYWRPPRHKYRYICYMCQWISAVCPPMVRCPTAHIFSPSAYIFSTSTHLLFPSAHIFSPPTYILYIRCNSLPPRVRPVGVGVLPPHAKAINIGYKGLWLGSEDESCRFGNWSALFWRSSPRVFNKFILPDLCHQKVVNYQKNSHFIAQT